MCLGNGRCRWKLGKKSRHTGSFYSAASHRGQRQQLGRATPDPGHCIATGWEPPEGATSSPRIQLEPDDLGGLRLAVPVAQHPPRRCAPMCPVLTVRGGQLVPLLFRKSGGWPRRLGRLNQSINLSLMTYLQEPLKWQEEGMVPSLV